MVPVQLPALTPAGREGGVHGFAVMVGTADHTVAVHMIVSEPELSV